MKEGMGKFVRQHGKRVNRIEVDVENNYPALVIAVPASGAGLRTTIDREANRLGKLT